MLSCRAHIVPSRAALRRFAALLLVAVLHGLALPVAAADSVPASDDCEHCHVEVGTDPCLMSAGADGDGDAATTAPRTRPVPPAGDDRPVLLLPRPERALAGAARTRQALATSLAGRHTGDPPRHLAVGRLLI